ncbi:hypothetical protein AVEN_26032-1 [Araneus ventricosus]|uniref:Uncharacterized protein n=1 Tax=Araneus ventricosus TaxID=182803 RepID=A0A4Y2E320_ARAVE|nr:hypothetical protein AVEN_26032-1 [Araneus ventricosus]
MFVLNVDSTVRNNNDTWRLVLVIAFPQNLFISLNFSKIQFPISIKTRLPWLIINLMTPSQFPITPPPHKATFDCFTPNWNTKILLHFLVPPQENKIKSTFTIIGKTTPFNEPSLKPDQDLLNHQ